MKPRGALGLASTLAARRGEALAYRKLATLVEVTLSDGDRLDLIAARTVGASEHFWRICDAENAMNPFDLEAEPGRRLRVPIPRAGA